MHIIDWLLFIMIAVPLGQYVGGWWRDAFDAAVFDVKVLLKRLRTPRGDGEDES